MNKSRLKNNLRYISIIICSIFSITISSAQNSPLLYGSSHIPQSLLLNPAEPVSQRWHMSIPILSGISTTIGIKGINAFDIFKKDGDIDTKIKNAALTLNSNDFFTLNYQMDIFNIGFWTSKNSYNKKTYLNMGLYHQTDLIAYFPSEAIDLYYQGTLNTNHKYNIGDITAKGEILAIWHIGASHKINSKWNIGGRLKVYSGIANFRLKNQNKGTFYTSFGHNNLYKHHLEDVNFLLETSGLISSDHDKIKGSDYITKALFKGNLGLGIDIGFVHEINYKMSISASLLDIGFVNNSKHVKSYQVIGNYATEGINLSFDPNNPKDYWMEFKDNLEKSLPLDTISKSYNTFRPLKLNAYWSYHFKKSNSYTLPYLHDNNKEGFDSLGFYWYTVFRPKKPKASASIFYQKFVRNDFYIKASYTIDSFSYTNFSVGISKDFGNFQVYGMFINILDYINIAKANSTGFDFGMNLRFGK